MIVAGYSNARQCHIPSLRLLKEGGYEPHDSIPTESFPGPFSDQVEEIAFSGIHEPMQAVGRVPVRQARTPDRRGMSGELQQPMGSALDPQSR
jgi:hypothetical protein